MRKIKLTPENSQKAENLRHRIKMATDLGMFAIDMPDIDLSSPESCKDFSKKLYKHEPDIAIERDRLIGSYASLLIDGHTARK